MKTVVRFFSQKNQIRAFWNEFSDFYGDNLEDSSLLSSLSLSKMLKLNSAKNILEVGCGTGILSLYWLQNLAPGTKYTSVDFSENMIKTAQQRKESFKHKLNNIDHSFIVGDAEDLNFVPDNSVDVYISPFCLHIVPDVNKALKEAVRVTKKGGRIGFSVLGPYEKNTLFKIFDDNLLRHVKEKPASVPNIHHLGDKEKLVNLAKNAGIRVDYCWEEDNVSEIYDEKDLRILQQNSVYGKMFADSNEDIQCAIMKDVKKDFEKAKNKFIPLKMNSLLFVGRKLE